MEITIKIDPDSVCEWSEDYIRAYVTYTKNWLTEGYPDHDISVELADQPADSGNYTDDYSLHELEGEMKEICFHFSKLSDGECKKLQEKNNDQE